MAKSKINLIQGTLMKHIYIASCLWLFALNSMAQTHISVSMRPIYDLLNEVSSEELQVTLLEQSGHGHHKHMTPKTVQQIAKSDYVLIIRGLDEQIQKSAEKQKVQSIDFSQMSENLIWKDEDIYDSHIWLSPKVMEDMIKYIQKIDEALINKESFENYLNWQKEWAMSAKDLTTPSWAVYHPAYVYLEDFLGFDTPHFLSHDNHGHMLPQNVKHLHDHSHSHDHSHDHDEHKEHEEQKENEHFKCLITEDEATTEQMKKKYSNLDVFMLDPSGQNDQNGQSHKNLWTKYISIASQCQKDK